MFIIKGGFFALLLLLSSTLQAQGRFGVESNLVPFFLDGYHISAWHGKEGYRARLVTAQAEYPDDLTAQGFEDKRLTFYEIEFDIFTLFNTAVE